MFTKLNMMRKLQQPSLLNKRFLKKPTILSHQAPAPFQASFGNFLKETHKPNYPFFTFNPLHKVYGYQQRFISTSHMDARIEWQTLLQKLRDNDASLSKLDLRRKQLGDAGAKELAIVLQDNHTLTELDLSGNRIFHAGGKELAIALKTNHTLTRLTLGYNDASFPNNEIGDEGAQAFAIALQTNRSLLGLFLGWNGITDLGANALAKALKDNYTLTAFYIKANEADSYYDAWMVDDDFLIDESISDEMAKKIEAIIQRNCALRDEMHEAVRKGDVPTVNQYWQQGVSLLVGSGKVVCSGGTLAYLDNTALHWAVIAKQPHMAAHLLRLMRQQGMPLDTRNSDGKTAADLAQGMELEALFTSAPPSFTASADNKESEEAPSAEVEDTPKNKR